MYFQELTDALLDYFSVIFISPALQRELVLSINIGV
jgi:hypothetical protein